MKESDVEEACVGQIEQYCPGAVCYKHADRWTAGIPDRSVTWRRYDSWLEFKLWDLTTTFYDEFATSMGHANTQLLELIKLEKQTGRAWIIAYRKGKVNTRTSEMPTLEIYRPGALVDGEGYVFKFGGPKVPREFHALENVALYTRLNGVTRFQGFDHRAVVSLIHLTHRKEYEPTL